MSQTAIKISVIIPAYNSGEYLRRSVSSVLAQTRPEDEIIVVDDGSSDDTDEVAKDFGEKIRYIHQDNAGPGVARNTGIQAATGNWIAFLDADDEWLPGHLQAQSELLARHPDLAWSTGNYLTCLCDEDRRGPKVSPAKAKALLNGKDFFDDYFVALRAGVWGCTNTMIIQREVLLAAGLFRPGWQIAEDLDLWWRIAHRRPRIGYLPKPLAVYHMGIPDTVSQGHLELNLYIDLIERHLELAAKAGRLEIFRGFAAGMLRQWMRSMLFTQRAADIRHLLARFGDLFSSGYKARMRLLTAFPAITAKGCHAISWLVRGLKLRKQVVRKPKS